MNSRPNHDPFEHLATKEALTAVATRLDATLPHLATKADVKEVSNRFLTVLIGAIVTCFLAFYGMYSSMLDRLALVQQQIYASQQSAAAGQRELHAELRSLSREQQRLADEVRNLAASLDQGLKRSDARSRPAER